MDRVYLTNAFSLNMLPLGLHEAAELCVKRYPDHDFTAAVELAWGEGRLDCAVGRQSTVQMLWEITGLGPRP